MDQGAWWATVSTGSQRVGHNRATFTHSFIVFFITSQSPVFLYGIIFLWSENFPLVNLIVAFSGDKVIKVCLLESIFILA